MPLHVLNPAEGFSPRIGFFISGMDEVREQLHNAVEGMTNQYKGQLLMLKRLLACC